MKYRPEVDGLRAIAVLAVFIFHLDESLISGGYVGVDIFFVISGFLITRIILDGIANKTFTLRNFYERRIRRIFPVFFFVQIVVFIAGYIYLLPGDFENLGKHLAGATLSISNFVSMLEFDYFAASDFVKPMLHAWSLSIEEQFYLFFPLFLILISFIPRKQSYRIFLLILFTGSFFWNVILVQSHPSETYFLVFTRMWELIIGGLLSTLAPPRRSSKTIDNLLNLTGFILLLYPVFAYTSETTFPGWAALFPCLGTALLIRYSYKDSTIFGRLLALPPVVLIGKMSYSIYLWHWPVIIYYRYLKIRPIDATDRILIFLAVMGLSFLSWKYIEIPFRKPMGSRRTVFATSFVLIFMVTTLGLMTFKMEGFPERMPEQVVRISNISHIEKPIEEGLTVFGENPSVFIWGDSHVNSLFAVLNEVMDEEDRDFAVFWKGGWLPLLHITRSIEKNYREKNDEVLDYIKSTKSIETVVLVARWAFYTQGYSGNIGPAEGIPQGARFSDEKGRVPSNETETYDAFFRYLKQTVDEITKDGIRVVIVYPIPETGYNIPNALARSLMRNREFEIDSWVTPEESFMVRQKRVIETLDKLGENRHLVRIHPYNVLKVPGGYRVTLDGIPIYSDSNHLNKYGAQLLKPLFAETL